MASTSLLLANPNSERSSIICQLRDGRGVKIKISTGISIKSKHWSSSKYVLAADGEAITKNKSLKNLKDRVLNIYLTAKDQGAVADANYIREALKPTVKAKSGSEEFWGVWDYYLADKKDHFTKSSQKKFKTLRAHFEDFETKTKIPWKFETINASRLENLQSYFFDKGMNNQTTSKYIGGLKMFLNWAVANKYAPNTDYKNFSPLREKETLKVALTSGEIQAIRVTDLGNSPYLENVRELFLLSTLTGLRYSDYSRIKAEHLKEVEGAKFLQIRQQKTGDIVELPLTDEAAHIIQRLIEGQVHAISNQKMNSYVKELCIKAEINEPFEVHNFKGKLVITKVCPKHDLITTHTGRRTFATNLLLQGVPAEMVMNFTGHKDMVSFSKYVNIPKKTQMDMVRNALNKISNG
ncbi:MAG: tyrosine-type recombinase/integrase [Reichenbachiella sp.]